MKLQDASIIRVPVSDTAVFDRSYTTRYYLYLKVNLVPVDLAELMLFELFSVSKHFGFRILKAAELSFVRLRIRIPNELTKDAE